jgi:diacylglycerol kinase family enzyme
MRANEKFSLVSTDGVVLQSSLDSTGSTFVVDGDYSGYTFFFGRDYTFDVILTKLMIKENTETGVDVTDNGRLQVRSMKLNYSDSGTFKVIVNNTEKNRSFTYTSTGKNLGTKDTIIGKAIIQDGTFKFPVQDLSTSIDIEIIGDTPEPVTILSGSFDALFVPNSRRL